MSSYNNGQMDIGLYHVHTMEKGRQVDAGDLFTVDDGYNVHIYERPYTASTVAIRRAVAVAFIDEQHFGLEYRIAGRYPNYHVEEIVPGRGAYIPRGGVGSVTDSA